MDIQGRIKGCGNMFKDYSSALICTQAQQSSTIQDLVVEISQELYMLQQKRVRVIFMMWVPACWCKRE